MENVRKKLQQVCDAFGIKEKMKSFEEINLGNINHTYRVDVSCEDGSEKAYMVQAVNTFVFKNPVQVMENIDKVTRHLSEKMPDRTNLHFYHTADRKTYLFDQDGFWRVFNFIPSVTYNVCNDLEIVKNAGNAFGEFQMVLADFNVSDLYVTIPDFHNTRKRFENMLVSEAADPCGKVAEVREELDWLKSVQNTACILTDMLAEGKLPLRVTHNDTKINNVLFEKDSKNTLTVIDLDTVMPGLVGHDFGDAIRFAGNFVEEDSPEADKAGVNMEVFRAFTEGFLKNTAKTLTKAEIDTLAISCFVLTCEQAVRFLDDYIQGSPYFKINYPEHNLVRTRCQVALAKDMLRKMPEMEKVVQECMEKYR